MCPARPQFATQHPDKLEPQPSVQVHRTWDPGRLAMAPASTHFWPSYLIGGQPKRGAALSKMFHIAAICMGWHHDVGFLELFP